MLEKVNLYHLVGSDGRKYVASSRSRKKAMVVGTAWLVSYSADDLSEANGGERPVSVVAALVE